MISGFSLFVNKIIKQNGSSGNTDASKLYGDGQHDDSDEIQRIFETGGVLPQAISNFRVTRTINVGSGVTVTGAGSRSLIKRDFKSGEHAEPVLLCGASSSDITLSNFSVDGGSKSTMLPPILYSGNIFAGAAVLVQSDRTLVTGLNISTAWDNGLAVGTCDPDRNRPVVGQPRDIIISNIRTKKCGYGSGAGAGVNIGSSFGFVATNIYDEMSATGFAIDFGGGASGVASNIFCYYARTTGLYLGSRNCQIANVQIVGGCDHFGMLLDRDSSNSQLANISIRNVAATGVLVKGSKMQLTGVVVERASANHVGQSNGFTIDETTGAVDGLTLMNCSSIGKTQRYGLAYQGKNTDHSGISIMGGFWEGNDGGSSPDLRLRMMGTMP